MTRKECLEQAMGCVLRDRQKQYGEPEDCFETIAMMWSAYLGKIIQGWDVAAMMALLKIARFRHNPLHEDNAVDCAGYAACMVETATAWEREGEAKAEGCEELVQDNDVERVFGTLKKRPAPEYDAPQTPQELYQHILDCNPSVYPRKPTGEELAEMAEEEPHV